MPTENLQQSHEQDDLGHDSPSKPSPNRHDPLNVHDGGLAADTKADGRGPEDNAEGLQASREDGISAKAAFGGGIVTLVESDHGAVSKAFSLAPDGTLIPDSRACSIRSGFIKHELYASVSEFAVIIGTMPSHRAVMLGGLKAQFVPTGGGAVALVAKAYLATTPGAVARTKETCEFPAAPGMMMIDIDGKDMPPVVAEKIKKAGGVDAVLCGVVAELGVAARVVRASTSAGLSANGVNLSKGGINKHLYVAVEDMSDVPRFVETLHARLILKGYGWVYITKNGHRLVRTLIDLAVKMPNGLAFEGAPVLRPPLVQDAEARRPVATDGPAVDTRKAVPGLTGVERRMVDIAEANLRRGKAAEARAIAKKFDEEMAEKHARRSGRPVDTERRRVRRHRLGKLPPEWELEFDDPAIGVRTVAQVVVNAAIYEGCTLADPVEGVSYGRGKAMVMIGGDSEPFVHSFAHGGATYRLAIEEADIEKVIAATAADAVVDVVRHLAGRLAGGIDAMDRLVAATAKRAGVSRSAAKKALEDEIEALNREEGRLDGDDRAEQGEATDATLEAGWGSKVRIPAPAMDAERGEVAAVLDCILAAVDAAEPPMRNTEGQLVNIVERRMTGTHELRDNDDYEGEGEGEEETKDGGTGTDIKPSQPAPLEPRLVRCETDVSQQMFIERYITVIRASAKKGGPERKVALDSPFCRALNEMAPSEMPDCRGVSVLPVVLVSARGRAKMFAGEGLDRGLGVVFRIPPALRRELEGIAGKAVTDAEMRAAYVFLRDEWLADVLTDENGKAVLIAMLLTILQRFGLDELPFFMMSGAQRGTGKTTAINMVAAAAMGCRAPASPWSGVAEERRKALYAFFLEGSPLLVFDNLRRGMMVEDETLSAIATANKLKDRKLGDSVSPVADACGVIAMTGNRIAPKGDLASRFLSALFTTDRPDPENRDVKRVDPVGWTVKNRSKVLVAAMRLLLGDRRMSEVASPPSRFKAWWRQIGRVIERASSLSTGSAPSATALPVVDFGSMFTLGEEDEPEMSGAVLLFKTIRERLGVGWLTTPEIHVLFEQAHWTGSSWGPTLTGDDAADAAAQADWNEKTSMPDVLKDALVEASGRGAIRGVVTVVVLGQRLKAAAGRTVDLEGVGVVTLEGQIDRHRKTAVWRVAVVKASATTVASDIIAQLQEFRKMFGEAAYEEFKALFGVGGLS